jgi:uncharacterized membrane protein YwaF
MAIERVDLSLRAYANNLLLLLAVAMIAFYMNSILAEHNANYLYLRKPPMDGLPILNLNHGWFVYLLILALIACTLVFLVQLPFIVKDLKRKRREAETKNIPS